MPGMFSPKDTVVQIAKGISYGEVYRTPRPVKIIRYLKTRGYLVEYTSEERSWVEEAVLSLPEHVNQRTSQYLQEYHRREAALKKVSDEIGPLHFEVLLPVPA